MEEPEGRAHMRNMPGDSVPVVTVLQGPRDVEHSDRLGALEPNVQSLGTNVQSLEAEVRQGFGSLATGQAEITALPHVLLPDGNE
jgi:hypothetical protein